MHLIININAHLGLCADGIVDQTSWQGYAAWETLEKRGHKILCAISQKFLGIETFKNQLVNPTVFIWQLTWLASMSYLCFLASSLQVDICKANDMMAILMASPITYEKMLSGGSLGAGKPSFIGPTIFTFHLVLKSTK